MENENQVVKPDQMTAGQDSGVVKPPELGTEGLEKTPLAPTTPQAGEKTDPALLLKSLQEEREKRKVLEGKLEDLETVLRKMEGGSGLAERLYKFTKGSYAGFTNQPTNIDIKNRFIAFSIRDLEDELRPIAMYIILNFIWSLIRAELKKRLMIVDEAWWMMKYETGASFLFGLAKRCRKYYLGLTTITQDVEDFMRSPYGRPIITNSSLQLLLKQAPATIDVVTKTFNLTEQETMLLLEANIGEGLFFAGLKHVAIKVVSSYTEDRIITTSPAQILEIEKEVL